MFRWLSKNPDADGVLQPVVYGTRFLYLISAKVLVPVAALGEKQTGDEYPFDEACKRAASHLVACKSRGCNTVIIDDYGWSESWGGGLRSSVNQLVEEYRQHEDKSLFVVVPSEVVKTFISDYQLAECEYKFIEPADSILE